MPVSVAASIKYAQEINDGVIPACRWVMLACRRFFNDLKFAENRGYIFDEEKAKDVLDFYDHVPHIKGEWAGSPIKLSPWQGFCLINLFGWVHKDTGLRRFRSGYIEVGRKNGKSTFVAPVGLYMVGFDGEAGSEVYSAATSRDQARIVFDAARDMTRKSELKNALKALNHSVCEEGSASAFKPLAADSDTLEGKNTHCAIIDELHAHKNRRVYDVLELSCAARSQPLLLTITTAGDDRTGICYEVRDYLTKVLEGVFEDDSCFGIIYTLDDPEEWKNEQLWIQANPNLGISVKLDDMRRLCQKAQQTPSAASEFKRKRLDIWCEGEAAYFNMEDWRLCPQLAPDPRLKGLPCYLALDLSSKRDISALIGLFPDDERHYQLKVRFYLPEAVLDPKKSGKAHHIQKLYKQWADGGWLTLTPGQIIDYSVIYKDAKDWAQHYDAAEIAFDPWGATQLATQLQEDGFTIVQVQQSVKNFSEAMKETDAVMIDHRIHHEHNPVMAWMMSNVNARVDKNDNVFPNKLNDESKIDGPVATFMAMNRALLQQETDSVYDEEDLLVV